MIKFNRSGNVIYDLTINRQERDLGLFDEIGSSSKLLNIGLNNINITSPNISYLNGAASVYVIGDVAYVASRYSDSLSLFNVSDSNNIVLLDIFQDSNNVGGLVGYNYYGSVDNSYWDTDTSGQATSDGGTGKTTVEMKQEATFIGWEFTNIWNINETATYPFLR